MKAACITIHRPVNFGSALQTLATQVVWERQGVELQTIDYIPARLQCRHRVRLLLNDKSLSWKKRVATFLTMDLFNRRVFDSFIRRYVRLTERSYHSLQELTDHCPQADFYLTGSDQVWNSFYNGGVDPAFFLAFLPDGACRFSFASSFGTAELNDNEKNEIIVALSHYSLISVREQSAVEQIAQMGLPVPTLLPDPALLLNRDEWLSLFPRRTYEQRYVLVYPMSFMDPELFSVARQAADVLGAEVWCLSPGLKRYKECDRTLRFRSPEEFVSLVGQAQFVVTNSFHGTAFAVNMERPFATIMPYAFGTRIESLLNRLSLSWRIWHKGADVEPYLKQLPHLALRQMLDADRRACTEYMKAITNMIYTN